MMKRILWLCLLFSLPAFGTVDGTCNGTTSCTPSATKVGNVEIAWAYHAASVTVPTLPANWTSVTTGSSATGANRSWLIACRVVQSSTAATSGVFTNATNMGIVSISGSGATSTANCATDVVAPIGTANSVSSATATFSALTLNAATDIALMLMGSSTSGQTCMPTGVTSKTATGDINIGIANAIGNWAGATCSITSSVTTEIVVGVKAETVLTACSGTCPVVDTSINSRSNQLEVPTTPFAFHRNLTEPAVAGDAIICGLGWDGTIASNPVTVTDDASDSYSVLKSGDDGTRAAAIVAALNVASGAQALTFTFSSGRTNFVSICTAAHNVATSSALDGTPTAAFGQAGPAVAPGSITTTVDNDLIFGFAMIDNDTFNAACTAGTACVTKYSPVGSGYTVLANSPVEESVAWWGAWGTHGAINPTIRVYNPAGNDNFRVVAVALKSASSGGVPPGKNGMYIRMIEAPGLFGAGTFTVPFPAAGNTAGGLQGESQTDNNWTAMSDFDANAWTKLAYGGTDCNSVPTSCPQVWYSQNQTHGSPNNETITFTEASAVTASPVFYDIVGARTPTSFDTYKTAQGTQTAAACGALPCSCPGTAGSDVDHAPDITPGANSGGIALAAGNEGTGPWCGPIQATSFGVASGYVYDSLWYPNESDNSPDQGNPYAHKPFTGTSTLDFGYHTANGSGTPSSWTGVAVTFLAPPLAATNGGFNKRQKLDKIDP